MTTNSAQIHNSTQKRRRKRKTHPLWAVLGTINALCLVVFVLRMAIYIPSLDEWFYRWQFAANDTYNVVNMEPEHLMDVTRHMIAYMRGDVPDLQIMTTVGGQPRYFFSDIEIRHMVDVYELFAAGNIIVYTAAIIFALTSLLFVLAKRRRLRTLFRCWRWTAVAVLGFAMLLVAAIAINWHQAFVIFHEILFDNDYWILDARVDLLVNIVPYRFFITLSIVIGGFFLLGLGIIFTASAILLKRTRRRRLYLAIAAIITPLLAFGIFWAVMRITLFVLLGILGLILLLLLLALFTKIRYQANAKKAADAPLEYNVQVRLLWGLIKKRIENPHPRRGAQRAPAAPTAPPDIPITAPTPNAVIVAEPEIELETEPETEPETESETEEKQTIIGTLRELGYDTIKAIVGHTIVLLKRVFRVFYPKKIAIKGRYGAAEPDTTGMVLAAIGMAAGTLGIFADIEGDFENETLEIDAHISGYLRLWALLVPLARYIFKPEIKPIVFGFLFKKSDKKPKKDTEERENGNGIKQ